MTKKRKAAILYIHDNNNNNNIIMAICAFSYAGNMRFQQAVCYFVRIKNKFAPPLEMNK